MSDKVQIPGYKILRELGAGGMATVYLAQQMSLDRQVAIKVLHKALHRQSDDFKTRFRNEGLVMAKITHPNIAAIYDIGEVDDMLYMVTEYVSGGDLRDRLKSGDLAISEAVSICIQVGWALQAAHKRKVVHRDVKPSNILFRDDETPVLTDFGIALQTDYDNQMTGTGLVIGTLQYMSPEQIRGLTVDHRSDIYSLGLMFYRMLTGKLPFTGESQYDLARKQCEDPPPPLPSSLSRFQPIMDNMLAKDPDDRFQSALDFCTALEKLSGDDEDFITAETPVFRPSPPTSVSTSSKSSGWLGWLFGRKNDDAPFEDDYSETRIEPIPPPPAGPELDDSLDEGTQLIKFDDSENHSIEGLQVEISVTRSPDHKLVGSRIVCSDFPFTIGRADSSNLSIKLDPALSRDHARIEKTPGGYVIVDNSTNGLIVNGYRVKGSPEQLLFGSKIDLSADTSLTFIASMDPLPDLTGEVLNNRFRVEELLHQSIKASTYRCYDEDMRRAVALKLFSPDLMNLEHYRKEFEQQAALTTSLNFPRIVKVFEFKEIPEVQSHKLSRIPYVCTEYMDGGNLSKRLESGKLPNASQSIVWIIDLARALDYAHRNQVIHGDLKPNCIVFDREELPYITDFAMATTSSSGSRATKAGTPAFLAPEQWDGKKATELTDQYSLAVVAYLLLSGSKPYEGQANLKVRERNFSRGAEPVHKMAEQNGRTGIKPSYSPVLEKALSINPEDRYPSILEFAQALQRAETVTDMSKSDPRVFISYQRETSAGWANLFQDKLEDKYGYDVFLDATAVDGSPKIPTRIVNEISRCDVFVCLLGPKTLSSRWVQEEIKIAYNKSKPMIPVFHEGFRPKDFTDMPDYVQELLDFNAVILLDRQNIYVSAAIEELVRNIKHIVH